MNRYHQDNTMVLHQHFDMLINKYSKLFPIRLDFHYDTMTKKGPQGAYTDMYLLYLLAKNNHNGIVGFAFSIEKSTSERLHIHSVFYIDGQRYQNYYPFFELLKNIWDLSISHAGNVHCCNLEQKYTNNALKNIDYQDKETQTYLKNVLNYMSKEEQKEKIHPFYQIGVSTISPRSNRGRPRNDYFN